MSKFESSPIVQQFNRAINHHLAGSNPHMICGVSGGVDSMVLLYLLHKHNIKTTVIHCNYQKRGKESDADQELVEEICMLWGLDCVSVKLNPKEAEGKNFQGWARDRRYQIFRDIKSETGANYIVTAHHRDDQLETIFQKILRGSGFSSWKGMQVLEEDLFRPLLSLQKDEILEFAKENHIPFRDDKSNESSKYARNFLRNEWVPQLNELFPGWQKNLLSVSERAEEFELLTEELLQRVRMDDRTLDREKFLSINKKVWPALILQFLNDALPNLSVTTGFLDQIEKLKNLQTGAKIVVSDDYSLFRDRHKLVLRDRNTEKQVEITFTKKDLSHKKKKMGSMEISMIEWDHAISETILQFDVDRFTWPLTIRTWNEMDKIQPFGMKGSQSVAKLLANKKVSAVEKNKAKVLQSFDGKICAVIFPHLTKNDQFGVISEEVKCTSKTETIVLIENII
ncbi:MAG: tRNA lysidine(34) synthetase TilS [Balneolaceae bacterium]